MPSFSFQLALKLCPTKHRRDPERTRLSLLSLRLNPAKMAMLHAREAVEYQRLRSQAAMWQKAKDALLDRPALAPGMPCLDVGSGPRPFEMT